MSNIFFLGDGAAGGVATAGPRLGKAADSGAGGAARPEQSS